MQGPGEAVVEVPRPSGCRPRDKKYPGEAKTMTQELEFQVGDTEASIGAHRKLAMMPPWLSEYLARWEKGDAHKRRVERLSDSSGKERAWSISVVIPFFNGGDYIERALASAFYQTLPPHEVIVVNDGSAPEHVAVLEQLQELYPFRRIDTNNSGQGAARNVGVSHASGDLVGFLDQDDFYLPWHNEILVGEIPSDDPIFGWVYGDLYEATVEGTILKTSKVRDLAPHPKTDIHDLLRADMFVVPSASLLKRSAFLAVGGFDARLKGYEDDDLFLRLFAAGYSNYFIDRAVTVWCFHADSTSYSSLMGRSRLIYLQKLMELFPDAPRLGRFYFRDILLGRFAPQFIEDAIRARIGSRPDANQRLEIFNDFVALTLSNKSVSPRFRRNLSLLQRALNRLSVSALEYLLSQTRFKNIVMDEKKSRPSS